MSHRIISVTAVALLLLMCASGFCSSTNHIASAKKAAENKSFKLGSVHFPVALELSTEHEGNFQFPSRWQTIRIRGSTKTIGTHNYVCPSQYTSSRDWSYNLKGSWEWCGQYCESKAHTNYMTDEKAHLLQNEIIPKAFAQVLQTAPLIRRETESLIFPGPLDHKHFCGYVRADENHYRRGIPDTDVMIYFSLSPFLYAERKSLVWSRSCHYSRGRITGAVINVNPCWLPNQIEDAVNKTAQEIRKALQIESCPEKNSIMLHAATEWYTNVVVCVEVKCKSDKTFEVRFKDGDWIPCPDHHVLGRNKGTEVSCPKFHEVCKEVAKTSTDGGISLSTRQIEMPVIETIEIDNEEEEEEEEEVEEKKDEENQEKSVKKSEKTVPMKKKDTEGNQDDSVSDKKDKKKKKSKNPKSKRGKKAGKPSPPPPESEYNVSKSDRLVLDQITGAARLSKDSSPMKAPYYAVIPAICAFLLTVIV